MGSYIQWISGGPRPLEKSGYSKMPEKVSKPRRQPHMGTAYFTEGVKNLFSCVHGSEMAIGEVMFLAAIAWVKRG